MSSPERKQVGTRLHLAKPKLSHGCRSYKDDFTKSDLVIVGIDDNGTIICQRVDGKPVSNLGVNWITSSLVYNQEILRGIVEVVVEPVLSMKRNRLELIDED